MSSARAVGARQQRVGVLVDWQVNRGRPQIQLLLLLLRLSQRARARHGGSRSGPLAVLLGALYRCVGLGICSVDIPVSTTVGPRLQIHHGMGLVVHSGTVLGSDVTLRQNTTIGSARSGGGAPRLGDGVSVGPNAVVLGEVDLGESVVVGAGSVVLASAPAGAVLVGNPARDVSA